MNPAPDGFMRCPFCASALGSMWSKAIRARRLIKYWVFCDDCGARGPWSFDRIRAHALWNERMYGDVNTSPEWTREERTGGPQVAEWSERHKSGVEP
jgi:hypothetical protein